MFCDPIVIVDIISSQTIINVQTYRRIRQALHLEVCFSISHNRAKYHYFQTKMSRQPQEGFKKKTQRKENNIKQKTLPYSTQLTSQQQYPQKISEVQREKDLPSIRSIQQSPTYEIQQLIEQCPKQPNKSFQGLLKLYETDASLFLRLPTVTKQPKQKTIRSIFNLVKQIISFHDSFPFLQSEKTCKIFDDLRRVVSETSDRLSDPELSCIETTAVLIWQNSEALNQINLILKNGLACLFKVTIALGKSDRQPQERTISLKLIERNVRGAMMTLQSRSPEEGRWISELFYKFFRESLDNVIMMPQGGACKLPIFDMMGLSLSSIHSQIYQGMMEYLVNLLKWRVQRQDQAADEGRSAEQSDISTRLLCVACNAFNIKSIFAGPLESDSKCYYSRQINFLVLIIYRSFFLKLIEELEKIDRNYTQKQVVRSIFEVSTVGNAINIPHAIKQILYNIFLSQKFKKYLLLDPTFLSFSSEQSSSSEPTDALIKTCEKSLFDLLYRMEKALSLYNLQFYMDLYVQSPTTFRSEYFIENLFVHQCGETIVEFMAQFSRRWILVEVKAFDFNFYLFHFLRRCVEKDKVGLIGSYVKSLNIQELLRVNSILFRASFQEDKKRVPIPGLSNHSFQFASITSAGFSDKYLLINKIFLDFSEQLVWKDLITFIQPSPTYLLVKAFYSVLNYEFTFGEGCPQILEAIELFANAIAKQKLQEVYAIFHWLTCVCSRREKVGSVQQKNKNICQQKLFQITIDQASQLMSLCELVCQRRRAAMNHVVLSSEMMNENIRYFDKMKRMHTFFLKSMVQWMQKLQNVDKMVKHLKPYEQIIEICCKLSKDVQFPQYHLIRTLSNVCSQKYFSSLLQNKVVNKVLNKELIATNYVSVLRQIVFNMMQRYFPEQQPNHYCLVEIDILSYFLYILASKMSITNERQILKQKLIILDLMIQLTKFFVQNPMHPLQESFQQYYRQQFKDLIVEIAVQNPQLVSKYQRQLILHLRIAAINHILQYFGTQYEVLEKEDLFSLVFELCFDKLLQIRLYLLNILTSRFKTQWFRYFLSHKHHIMVYLTIFAIFEPSPPLNLTAKKLIQTIKKVGDQSCSLGLVILLYSLKLIFSYILNALLKEEYHLFLDYFLKHFQGLWLSKKQWEFAAYSFSQKFLEERRLSFIISEFSFKSWIQPYITNRQKSDFILESQIKQYLRNDFEFSFDLPPEESPVNFRMNYIKNAMNALSFRAFAKLKAIVVAKARPSRVIKSRKDIKIDWKALQEHGLIRHHSEPLEPDKIKLSLI